MLDSPLFCASTHASHPCVYALSMLSRALHAILPHAVLSLPRKLTLFSHRRCCSLFRHRHFLLLKVKNIHSTAKVQGPEATNIMTRKWATEMWLLWLVTCHRHVDPAALRLSALSNRFSTPKSSEISPSTQSDTLLCARNKEQGTRKFSIEPCSG